MKRELRHGTAYMYGVKACRCDVCTDANTTRTNRSKVARWGTEPPVHGASGFVNYGCHCDVCVQGNRETLARKRKAAGPGVNRRKEWSKQDLRRITAMRPDGRRYRETAFELATKLGRSVGAVNQQRSLSRVKSAQETTAPR